VSDGGPPTDQDDLARGARLLALWLLGAIAVVAAVVVGVRVLLDDGDADDGGVAVGGASITVKRETTATEPPSTTGPARPPSTRGRPPTTRPTTPVKVGFVNQEALVGAFPDLRVAAERAVASVNDGGGVDGRPLELVVCTTDSTPERSRSCAEDLVREQVAVVTLGIDFGSPALYRTLADAGIPVVGGVPRLLDDYRAPNAHYFVGGSVVTLPALAEYAAHVLAVPSVTVVHRDVATTDAAARSLLVGPLEAAGVEVDVVEVSSAATPRPSIGATGAVVVLADADDCATLAGAARSAAPGVPLLLPSSCGSVAAVAALGIAGPVFVPSELADVSGPRPVFDPRLAADLDRYLDAMGSEPAGAFAPAVFAAIVNVHELLSAADEPTAEGVTRELATGRDRPGFLGHPFDCAEQHLSLAPAVCQSAALVYGVGAGDGDIPSGWTDGSALLS
jgi:branched-chain amino acid transport system substrate-binding protein